MSIHYYADAIRMREWLITSVTIHDGSGDEPYEGHVSICDGKISNIYQLSQSIHDEGEKIDGGGLILCPGFIDTHSHDDLRLISDPELLCKLTQGVTTVVVGNCGISGAPYRNDASLIEPINLLGSIDEFQYSTFLEYRNALENAQPAVNVVALVGHTSLRQKYMNGSLHRAATVEELENMRLELRQSLHDGASGFSTGLAYANAKLTTSEEIQILLNELTNTPNVTYASHIRTEADEISDALEEAFSASKKARVPLVVSHLKCAEKQNWNRSQEVLDKFEKANMDSANIGYDCYPYIAGSTIIDLNQVKPEHPVRITWSQSYPEMAGRWLADIAQEWRTDLIKTAQRLQPGGAIYFIMNEHDVRRIIAHPLSMIGSDGIPNDRRPHPRLWGTFPRVLRKYCLEEKLFPMATAIRKMTSVPAERFHLKQRGLIKEGYWADLVLFNPRSIADRATFESPMEAAAGVEAVWVNGVLSYRPTEGVAKCLARAGQFLERKTDRV